MDTAPGDLPLNLKSGVTGAASFPIDRLNRAKRAYSVRRVPIEEMAGLITGDLAPRPGDLVLARVVRLRQHGRLELGSGRRARLFPGDEIIVCYGHRYAPDQFESRVPDNLGPCHLVAAGGIASYSQARSSRVKPATEIEPLGLIRNRQGEVLNIGQWGLPKTLPHRGERPLTIAVVGTAMNAGKTTTAAHLIRGLVRAGQRVAAAKLTGTGAGGDRWFMQDCGADPVLDFTDMGYPSTFRVPPGEVERISNSLLGYLISEQPDSIVLEVADGLFQTETAELLAGPFFRNGVDGVIFAAGDAMGAVAGSGRLQHYGLSVLGLSGALTASPMAMAEAERETCLPVFTLEQLESTELLDRLQTRIANNTQLTASRN